MTDAVVYKLYSLRPLSTAANQQLPVSTGTIATYFGNLAPPCGCLHTVVHELCVRAPIGAIVPKGLTWRLWEEKKMWLGQDLGRQRLTQLDYKKCSTIYYDHSMAST